MPYILTTPQVETPLGGYHITGLSIDVEAGAGPQITISYVLTDGSGNALNPGPGNVSFVLLGPTALGVFQSTAGGLKAKAYAALVSQLGLAAGTTS